MIQHILLGPIKVSVDDILVIRGEGNYSKIFTIDGKSILSCRTLKYFALMLKDLNFIRPSKSSLINPAAIEHIDFKSQKTIRLVNKDIVTISRRNVKPLKLIFSNQF